MLCYFLCKKKLLSQKIAGGPVGPVGNLRRLNNFNLNKLFIASSILRLGRMKRDISYESCASLHLKLNLSQ